MMSVPSDPETADESMPGMNTADTENLIPMPNAKREGFHYVFRETDLRHVYAEKEHSDATMVRTAAVAEAYIVRAYQEFFATLGIGVFAIIMFFVEMVSCLYRYVIMLPFSRLVFIMTDLMLKPCLTLWYNDIIHPIMTFFLNVLHVIIKFFEAALDLFLIPVKAFADVVRAFRLCEVRVNTGTIHGTIQDV